MGGKLAFVWKMYGTPVVGANSGGIPELIQQGKTGELFGSGSEGKLIMVITKLWSDDRLSKKCVKNV